jgi:predicted dehydrogenase
MKKVRVGILGCGGFAGAHARRYKAMPEVQVAALCDKSPEQMESLVQRRLAEVSPAPERFTDIEAFFTQAGLDAVSILTPHTLHFEHAEAALRAGLDVLVEKPMVTRTEDAEALVRTVEQTGRLLQIGYNTAYTAPVIYLRDSIRQKRFGALEMVSAYLSQNWKKLTSGSWRQDPSLSGGGQAYDSGAHLLNTLCWATESDPVEVYACLDRQETQVDINTSILARLANGAMATIAISGNCPADGSHATFIFDGGRVDLDGWNGQWIRAWNAEAELTASDLPAIDEGASPNRNFIAAILGQAEPLCTAVDGLRQCRLMDAIYESARTGQPVALA